jgi:hypothetical protein
VCAWIGNSQTLAAKHYLQVIYDHFEQAAASPKAVHNPVQHPAASARTGSHGENGPTTKPFVYVGM